MVLEQIRKQVYCDVQSFYEACQLAVHENVFLMIVGNETECYKCIILEQKSDPCLLKFQ